MADTEEYFPRGGKKPTVPSFKQTGHFLGSAVHGEKRKKKPKNKSEGDDGYLSDEAARHVDQSVLNCAFGLSYQTTKPGVLLLGRVRRVCETWVYLMLPCKMTGSVMACHISEPYNKMLEAYVNDQVSSVRELPAMFRAGQYVAVSVLEVDNRSLRVSMMPQHVNGAKTTLDLQKGSVLQAAVSSVEDHGYVMDIGIPDTRAFLPKKNCNPEIELDTGMLTWCCIKSVTPSSDSSVVTLSSHLDALQQGVLRASPRTPLLPGTAVDFTIDKPLESGIEGRVFGQTTAYVQRAHADTSTRKKPNIGQRVRARVLYVMPTRNTPYLTTRDIFATTWPDLAEEQQFREGDAVDAQVIKIIGRAVHFRLGAGSTGSMRLKQLPVDDELTDQQLVAQMYPIGSTHEVRVLCYHLVDYTYSVTTDPAVLSERYFNLAQLAVGELVTVTVRLVTERGLTLNVGRVTGLVPQAHLSEAGMCLDPKKPTTSKLTKKFKVGQTLSARVLDLNPVKECAVLTLKPSLLAPDLDVLSSCEQADIGKAYTGVIKYIHDNYLLVSFFRRVTAYVPRRYVTREPMDSIHAAFHIGQIVNCTILRVDDGVRISGSLITAPFYPATKGSNKHKYESDQTDEVPSKKRKANNDETHVTGQPDETEDLDGNRKDRKKKKDKKSVVTDDNETLETDLQEESNKGHKKKKKGPEHSEENDVTDRNSLNNDKNKSEVSEESDAIETDIYDSDNALTPRDLGLMDLSDCVTTKKIKRRVLSLMRALNGKARRIDVINNKIDRLVDRGVNPYNNKFRMAMLIDKKQVETSTQKLLEVLKVVQDKLKDCDIEKNTDYKIEQAEKRKLKRMPKKEQKEVKEETGVIKKKIEAKSIEIQVVDSLEPALDVPSAKDFWTSNPELPKKVDEAESSSSEDEEKDQPKKKRKKLTVAEKVAKAREEDERVREMERRAIDSESQPRSSEQFERALLANPDCSQLWIAYMAFHLQATEIDKARGVCRKALATISFREEAERRNVWLALLNCEHRFGNKESQQKTLEEALQMNEPFHIHSALLDILVETGKQQELSSLVDLMLRKYRRDPPMYKQCGGACFKGGLVDKARQVMQKAVAVLEKKEHVSILVHFALLERSHGGLERAEAVFEQVLAAYPARVDVCSTYADMLLKGGDAAHVRQVMERMTSQKLPARKMKVLYKKWIEVEEKLGDQTQVDIVRQRAMEFIDKAKF